MASIDLSRWNPTREAGLARLADFLPRAGRDYSDRRNFDLGPDDRSHVSGLSPYLRHRLVTEEEVVAASVGRHGFRAAEKFVGETCWRTYWKGWLELRPGVWSSYRAEVRDQFDAIDRSSTLRDRFDSAISGDSGIACVDLWARELVEHGYLHNHARMWFASLWVFTLGLPWAIGADFFLRHLMDGDPASNTLSWRWVAGLQTKGKTYAATASNIARFTEGRINPREPLASHAEPLEGPPDPPWRPLGPTEKFDPRKPFALLLTEEDLSFETLDLSGQRPVGLAGILATERRSPREIGAIAREFAARAVADALNRAEGAFDVAGGVIEPDLLETWATGLHVEQVVTPFAPVGPVRDLLDRRAASLAKAGIRLVRLRRPWDDELWPHATAGYFRFKKELESSLGRLGVLDGK
jgi:deoxyribodipyrimidine photo-lyase